MIDYGEVNEIVYIGIAIIDFVAVALLARLGKEWLFGIIGVNMILITTFGGKLVEVFGYVTNAGNAFYAAVFLAFFMFLDREGLRVARQGIWIGFSILAVFVLMAQIGNMFIPIGSTHELSIALDTVFSISPRIFMASIFAYFVSLYTLTWVFQFLRRLRPHSLLLPVCVALVIAQALDSVLFFSIAFIEVIPLREVLEIMIIGFVFKVIAGIVAIPFIYLNRLHTAHIES